MLTAKELMQPRYKAIKSFEVKSNNTVLHITKGDVSDMPEEYLKLCPPDSVKRLQWWQCREPEDMPEMVQDKHRQPYEEYKRRYKVKMPFSNIERNKFQLSHVKPGTGWDFTARIENYVPVDSCTVKVKTSAAMGKTAFIKQVMQDHVWNAFDRIPDKATIDTLGTGFKQEPGIKHPLGYFSFNPGGPLVLPDSYQKVFDDLYTKSVPFLARLKAANEKQCPILKAPASSVKPQVQVLNISTAVGELCSKVLYRGPQDGYEAHRGDTADSIGDIAILLDSLSQRMGLSLEQCIQIRFNHLSLKQGNHDAL